MAVPHALVRLQKSEAYTAWKASGYALSELDEWCEENCAKYERTPEKLKAWIADCAANELSHAKLEAATDAQKVAKLVGATLPKALKSLVDGLSAMNVKPLVDRNGKVKGQFESPNWEARNSSSKEILKVLGAYAPEKVELFNGHLDEFTRLTDEELRRQIAEARKSAGTGDAAGTDGAESGKERLLLADGSDQDEGRAGPGESVQGVPPETVLSTVPQRTRQRTN